MCDTRRPRGQSATLFVNTTSRPSGDSRGSPTRGTLRKSTIPIGRGDCAESGPSAASPTTMVASQRRVERDRVIVPPSFRRRVYHRTILPVDSSQSRVHSSPSNRPSPDRQSPMSRVEVTMVRRRVVLSLLLSLLATAPAVAQTGQGSLRGYVKDEQGGALPGVAVSARSDALIQPVSSVSDAEGYFRLINLPPGTYEISAELSGFASFKRQGVLLRAGANFQVDIAMKIASLSETVTVSGESPMLEVSNPSNVLNISGEFQRDMPIQARRNWSDFLEITPGEIG